MAGRRSRSDAESDSDSSVQTIDESRLLWRPETEVLKKTRPRLPPDSWPIFALNEATLYKQDRKTLANALEVDFDGPFIVRGRVEMEDKLQAQRSKYYPPPPPRGRNLLTRGQTRSAPARGPVRLHRDRGEP